MKDVKARGRMSRDKGGRGERELRDLFRAHGFTAERGQQRKGSPDSPDVITDIDGLHVECKRTEALSLYKAMEQATADAGLERVPVVFHKRNKKPWLAVLTANDFLVLVRKLHIRGEI